MSLKTYQILYVILAALVIAFIAWYVYLFTSGAATFSAGTFSRTTEPDATTTDVPADQLPDGDDIDFSDI